MTGNAPFKFFSVCVHRHLVSAIFLETVNISTPIHEKILAIFLESRFIKKICLFNTLYCMVWIITTVVSYCTLSQKLEKSEFFRQRKDNTLEKSKFFGKRQKN